MAKKLNITSAVILLVAIVVVGAAGYFGLDIAGILDSAGEVVEVIDGLEIYDTVDAPVTE